MDEHLSWSSHWSGLKNKIKCEYAEKLLYAKKKEWNMLKEERDKELE